MDSATVKVVFGLLIAVLGSFAIKRILGMIRAGRQPAPRSQRKFATRRALYGKTRMAAPAGWVRRGTVDAAAYDALRQSRSTTAEKVRGVLLGETPAEAVAFEPLTDHRRVPLRWREVLSDLDSVQRWELRPDQGGPLLGLAEFHWVGDLDQGLGVALGRTSRVALGEWRPRGRTLFGSGNRTEIVYLEGTGPSVSVEVVGDLDELGAITVNGVVHDVDRAPVAHPLIAPATGEVLLSRTSLRFEISAAAPEATLDQLVLGAHFTTMRYGRL